MLQSGVYQKGQIDFISILSETIRELPKNAGCVTTFMGVTREEGAEGKKVSQLMIESYEKHANNVLEKICSEVKEKYGSTVVRIYHLAGELAVGDPIVLVIVASKGRKEAFSALREAVERYKTEPALFKKEAYVDGSHTWISHA